MAVHDKAGQHRPEEHPWTAPVRFGNYLLERRLAVGGMSEIFLASRIGPSQRAPVIIKRLLPGVLDEPQSREAFATEARLHQAARHPNVVDVLEAGEVNGEPYLALEYVAGVDAFRLMRRAQSEMRTLPASVAVHIARRLCQALQCVHLLRDETGSPLGIVHRDVTPSNIYLSDRGDVKLGDFGIARPFARYQGSRALKGKYAYLSPEQVSGDPFDHRADLFSLAVVLAEMLIGQSLFPGAGQLAVLLAIRDCRIDPLRSSAHQLPRGLYSVLERALAKSPDRRFASAGELSEALAPFEEGSAVGDPSTELAQWVVWAADADSLARRIEGALRESQKLSLRSMMSHSDPAYFDDWCACDSPTPDSGHITDSPCTRPGPRASQSPGGGHTDSPRPPSGPGGSPGEDGAGISQNEPPTGPKTLPVPAPEATVRTRTGRELHGLSFATLIELIVTGQLAAEDEVAMVGRPFQRLEDVEVLSRHLAPSTATTHRLEGPGVPDYAVELSSTTMLEVLAWVLARRETGALFADRQHMASPSDRPSTSKRATDSQRPASEPEGGSGRRKEIYFEKGKVVLVASSERSELFGEYLVSQGLLRRDELDLALAALPRYDGRLGDTLIGLGLVDAVDVFQAIQKQGRARVTEMFRWEAGRVSFYRGVSLQRIEFRLDLEIPDLMLAGLELTATEDRLEETYRDCSHSPFTAVRPPPSHALQVAWPSSVLALVGALGSGRTLEQLVSTLQGQNKMGRAETLRALAVALAGGIVEKR